MASPANCHWTEASGTGTEEHVDALVGVAAAQPAGNVGSHIRYIVAAKERFASPHALLRLMLGASTALSFGRLTESTLP